MAMQTDWFYYSKQQQFGPMSLEALQQAISDGLLGENDYIYTEGFKDWQFLKDVTYVMEGVKKINTIPMERRKEKDRALLSALVVAHNDKQLATGTILDISPSGFFLATTSFVFKVKDAIKITLKEAKGLGKPIQLKAVVVRIENDSNSQHRGYGLEIENLSPDAFVRISSFVAKSKNGAQSNKK